MFPSRLAPTHCIPHSLQVSASVELIRIADAAGSAAVAAAAAFFATSSPTTAAAPHPSPSPLPRVFLPDSSSTSSPIYSPSSSKGALLPGFFSHRSVSSPATRSLVPLPPSSSSYLTRLVFTALFSSMLQSSTLPPSCSTTVCPCCSATSPSFFLRCVSATRKLLVC